LGVILLLLAIIVLLAFPILVNTTVGYRSTAFRPLSKFFFWLFVLDCLVLGWVGGKSIEFPYTILGLLATLYYFGYFLCILPVLRCFEDAGAFAKTKRVLKNRGFLERKQRYNTLSAFVIEVYKRIFWVLKCRFRFFLSKTLPLFGSWVNEFLSKWVFAALALVRMVCWIVHYNVRDVYKYVRGRYVTGTIKPKRYRGKYPESCYPVRGFYSWKRKHWIDW